MRAALVLEMGTPEVPRLCTISDITMDSFPLPLVLGLYDEGSCAVGDRLGPQSECTAGRDAHPPPRVSSNGRTLRAGLGRTLPGPRMTVITGTLVKMHRLKGWGARGNNQIHPG